MRSGQVAGYAILAVVVLTVYSLIELHRLTDLHGVRIDTRHSFAIEFIHMRRGGMRGSSLKNDKDQAKGGPSGPASSSSDVPSSTSTPVPGASGGSAATLTSPPVKVETVNDGKCIMYRNVDSWGIALNSGASFKVPSAGECCDACLQARGLGMKDTADCNMWVWCGDQERCGRQFEECWLKWLPYVRVAVPKEVSLNASVGWTSGTSSDIDLTEDMYGWKLKTELKAKGLAAGTLMPPGGHPKRPAVDPLKLEDTSLRKIKAGVKTPQMYHTITSVQGAYNQWQTRIHYYHWKKMQAECLKQGFCEMGGFTRLLHSGQPDALMDQIPTVVVDPMPSSLLQHDDYIVLNRPYAFMEWVKIAKIPERYVLMAEPDHIYLRPLPNFMTGDKAAAFNFGYMNPAGDENCVHIKRHIAIDSTPKCEQVAPIGNSPTFLTFDDMARVMPLWLNLSIAVYKDKEATKVWGWVQEMYAFAMAVWEAGIKEVDLIGHMLAQPPYDGDHELMPGRPFYILHYTYGLDFNTSTGKVLFSTVGDWHFDKREHDPTPIPMNIQEPPDTVNFDLGRSLVRAFNEATSSIPCWAQYRESKGQIITSDCEKGPS